MINSHTLQRNIRLDRHTSIGLGGDVDYFWTVVKSDDLPNVLEEVYALGHSPFILGGGSNLVVSDAGVQGSVVTSTSARPPVFGDEVVVDGGYEWDRFVADAVLAGWSGVELMSGIPGKVGAAPIQNIGAYGQEVSEVIQWVEVLWLDTLSVEVFDNASCEFAYRTSVFKALYSGRLIVTRVAFRLNRAEEVELQYKDLVERLGPRCTPQVGRQAVLKIRADKGMTLNHGHGYSSAGSFFMNPVIGRTQFESLAEAAGGQIPSWSVGDNEVKVQDPNYRAPWPVQFHRSPHKPGQ